MTGSYVIGLSDCVSRALLSALAATDTLVSIDMIIDKTLTYASGANLINNVSDVFLAEELKGCKNRVGSSLTKSAKGVSLNVVAKLLKSVDILKSSVTVGYLVKKLKKTLCTYAAGCALTAGLVNGELKEELSHINHTGVLVHNDKTA